MKAGGALHAEDSAAQGEHVQPRRGDERPHIEMAGLMMADICAVQTQNQPELFARSKYALGIARATVCSMKLKYRVKEHRKRLGWTQDHLSAISGVSKPFISQIETGAREPSAETLRMLALAFKVDATEMIEPDSDDARRVVDHLGIFNQLSREDQDALARQAAALLRLSQR